MVMVEVEVKVDGRWCRREVSGGTCGMGPTIHTNQQHTLRQATQAEHSTNNLVLAG